MNYHNVEFERSFGTASQLTAGDLPELAFAGRSNVGKSSMLNKLFNRKQLARVSAVPGKTATINFFKAEGLRFADLPGYGYARVSKTEQARWAKLMEGYFAMERPLRFVFCLMDMRHAPTKDDVAMVDFLLSRGTPFGVVMTKLDKLKKSEQEQQLGMYRDFFAEYGDVPLIPFSSKTGEGVEAVKKIIEQIEQEQNSEE